jgi:hypothetical protein
MIQAAQVPPPTARRPTRPAGGQPSLVEGGYSTSPCATPPAPSSAPSASPAFRSITTSAAASTCRPGPLTPTRSPSSSAFGPVAAELAYNHQNQSAERNDNFFSTTISVDVNGRPVHRRRSTASTSARTPTRFAPPRSTTLEVEVDAAAVRRHAPSTASSQDNYRCRPTTCAPSTPAPPARSTPTPTAAGSACTSTIRSSTRARSSIAMKPATRCPSRPPVDMRMLGFFASGTDATSGTQWPQRRGDFSATGRYFNGRLQSLIGVAARHQPDYDVYQGTRYTGQLPGGDRPPKRQDALPGDYVENQAQRLSHTTSPAGSPTRSPRTSMSTASTPSRSASRTASPSTAIRFPPIIGSTREIGLKGKLLRRPRRFHARGLRHRPRERRLSYNNVIGLSAARTGGPDEPERRAARRSGLQATARPARPAPPATTNRRRTPAAPTSPLMLRPTRPAAAFHPRPHQGGPAQPNLAASGATTTPPSRAATKARRCWPTAKLLLDSLDLPTPSRPAPGFAVVRQLGDRLHLCPRPGRRWRGVRAGVNGSWRDDYLFGLPTGRTMVGGTHASGARLLHARSEDLGPAGPRPARGEEPRLDLENGDLRKTGFTTMGIRL